MHEVVIHTGSNLGERKKNLIQAKELISEFSSIKKESSIYETAAWGVEDQQDFLNQAWLVQTELNPFQLLEKLQGVEKEMGREKKRYWGERIIDLDIIYFEDLMIHSNYLMIPHPRMQMRNFVLEPLLEICPEKKHPVFRMTTRELLAWCPDNLAVKKI